MKGHSRGPSPSSRLLSRTASSSSRLDLPTVSETHGDNVKGSKVLGGFRDAKLPGGTDNKLSALLRKGRSLSNRELPSASHPLPGQGPLRTSRVAQELMMNTGRRRGSSGPETSRTTSAQADGGEVGNEDWETRVWVWGCSANGQCVEDEGLLCLSSPRWLRSLETAGLAIKALACGRTVSVALTEMGQVWSWGTGPVLGREASARGPGVVDGLPADVVDVAVGEEHALACTRQGELYAWGLGAGGKLGTGDTNNRVMPVHVTAAPLHQVAITRVACGQRHSAVLCADGGLFTFGAGRAGQLGHGNFKDQHRPKKVGFFEGGEGVMGVSCGTNHTAAFTKDGQLYCWGWGEHGRLGLGDEESRSLPSLVGGALENRHVTGVSCGAAHTVATTEEGIVYAFGWNEYGQVRRKHAVVPAPASSSGSSHDLAVLQPMRVLESFLPPPPQQHDSEEEEEEAQKSDGDEYEEDYENSGEESGRKTERSDGEANSEAAEGQAAKPSSRGSLGQQKQQPEHEVAGNRVVKISAGFAHSAALTADGRLFLWGFGEEGQLGTGEEMSLGLPVELTSLPDGVTVVDVALGHCHSTALVSRLGRRALEVRWAKATRREQAAKALVRFLRMCLLRGRVRMLARVVAGERKNTVRASCGRKGGLVNLEEEDQELEPVDAETEETEKEVEAAAVAGEEAEEKERQSEATAEMSGEGLEEEGKEEASLPSSKEVVELEEPTNECEAPVAEKEGEVKGPEEEQGKEEGGEGEEEDDETYDDDFADDEEEEGEKKEAQGGGGNEREGVDAEEEAQGVAVVVAQEVQDAGAASLPMNPGDDEPAPKEAAEAPEPSVQELQSSSSTAMHMAGDREQEEGTEEKALAGEEPEATPRGDGADDEEELVIPPPQEALEVAAVTVETPAPMLTSGPSVSPITITKLGQEEDRGAPSPAVSAKHASTPTTPASPSAQLDLPTDMSTKDDTAVDPIRRLECVVKAVEPAQEPEAEGAPMSPPAPSLSPPPPQSSLSLAPPAPPAGTLEPQITGKTTLTEPGPRVDKRVSRIPKPSGRLWQTPVAREREPSVKATPAPRGAVAVNNGTHAEADSPGVGGVSKPSVGKGRRSKSPPHYDRPWRRGPRVDKPQAKADDSGDEHQAAGHKPAPAPAQRPWGGGGKVQATSGARQVGPGTQRRAMNRPLNVGKRQPAKPHVAPASVQAAEADKTSTVQVSTPEPVSTGAAVLPALEEATGTASAGEDSKGAATEVVTSGPPVEEEGSQAEGESSLSTLLPVTALEATAECEEPVAPTGLATSPLASEAEAHVTGVPASPVAAIGVVATAFAAVDASDLAAPSVSGVESVQSPVLTGNVAWSPAETGETEDVPPRATKIPLAPVAEPSVEAPTPADEKECSIVRAVVGNNQAEDAQREESPVKAEASVGGTCGASEASHDASSTTHSTAGQGGRGSRALPVWGAHRPNTAAKTRGLRGQMKAGHKLQQNWLRRRSKEAEAVSEEVDEETTAAVKGEEGETVGAVEPQQETGAAERRQEREAARVHRAEARRAVAKARKEEEEATRKPFPFLRRRSQSLADLPRASGGLKADGSRQNCTKGSQPPDYKYFKDRYCSETDAKDRQSVRSHCSSPTSLSKDEDVESHVLSEESDAELSKGKPRGGKGASRRVGRGHRRAASEGTMPVVEGSESEEDRTRRRSIEPIQHRSVLKMHRRLGLVQQRSAICLPRSAAASSQDGEPSGLDGPRRDVRRPYLQGANTNGQDAKPQAQAAPPMEFESLFHPAIEGLEGTEERPEVAEAEEYAEVEESHFLPSLHSVRSL